MKRPKRTRTPLLIRLEDAIPGRRELLFGAAGLAILVLLFTAYALNPREFTVHVGEKARTDGEYKVEIEPPQDFSGLSRKKLFNLREDALLEHDDLATGDYVPSEQVFGQLVDGKPWWSLRGYFADGPGGTAVVGLSMESLYYLNPFLLLAAELQPQIWQHLGAAEIERLSAQSKEFPFRPEPTSLTWYPEESRVEVVYDWSKFTQQARTTGSRRAGPPFHFNVVGYNAPDLGYTHTFFVKAQSMHITQQTASGFPTQPKLAKIAQQMRFGSACGVPGGCNERNRPHEVELTRFFVQRLPAQAAFHLWRGQPPAPTSTPDLTFVMLFQ